MVSIADFPVVFLVVSAVVLLALVLTPLFRFWRRRRSRW